MNANEYYEMWKKNNNKALENIKNEEFLRILEDSFKFGYYSGLETQEIKTSEYNWNKWNQK